MMIPFAVTRAVVAIVLLTAAGFLTGCKFGPDFERPDPELERAWRDAGGPFVASPVDQIEWWREFNDPVLNRLVEIAIANNPDLQTAALSIVQARAARAVGFLSFFPFITGGAGAAHVNFSQTVKPEVEVDIPELGPIAAAVGARVPRPEVTLSDSLDYYSVGVDAIWEIDLWGVKRRNAEALKAQLAAAYAGYDDVLVSVIAEVALNYIEIRSIDERIEALRNILTLQENFQAITEERFESGQAMETDFLLAVTLTGITASGVPALEYQRRVSENAIVLLTGIPLGDLEAAMVEYKGIPLPPPSIAVGIPNDLLRRRPDVRRAELLAWEQAAEIGKAKGNIMPSLALIGGVGLKSTDSDRLFKSDSITGTYGAAASITSLINYPAFVQKVRLEDAQFEQALLNYEETVLEAKVEAENAMFGFLRLNERVEILAPSIDAVSRASDLAVAAYQQGKVIVSVPLVALTIYASQQDSLIATRAGAAMQVVALNKALGGGWELRQQEQLLPEELRERMKDRSDWWSFGGRWALDTQREVPKAKRPARHEGSPWKASDPVQ